MNSSVWRGRFPRNDIISLLDVNRRHNLAESTSRNLRYGELIDMLGGAESLRDLELGYGSSAGLPALRQVLAREHGVSPEQVMSTQGSVQCLFLLAFELCRPGDHVLLQTPCFPPSLDVLTACGTVVDALPMHFDRGYRLDLEQVANRLTLATRLVSLASPQNPSGVATPTEDLRALLERMSRSAPDAWLFVDETYRMAVYGEESVEPSAAALAPNVIVGSSISKAYGAPGLRVGWLTTHDSALRERLIVAKMNIAISGSVLDETLAARLLALGPVALASRRRHLAQSLALLSEWCERQHELIEWVRPDAGALCCLRLRVDAFDDAALDGFWRSLPENELQLGAGEWFGDAEGRRILRLGFGFLPEGAFSSALAALGPSLRRAART